MLELLLAHPPPLGQMGGWHYNARTGSLFVSYPVLLVHQTGLAPISLLPWSRAVRSTTSLGSLRGSIVSLLPPSLRSLPDFRLAALARLRSTPPPAPDLRRLV